jgi:hypothetical protein
MRRMSTSAERRPANQGDTPGFGTAEGYLARWRMIPSTVVRVIGGITAKAELVIVPPEMALRQGGHGG